MKVVDFPVDMWITFVEKSLFPCIYELFQLFHRIGLYAQKVIHRCG